MTTNPAIEERADARGDDGPVGRLDADRCYRAVLGRDRRFDGVFYTAVRTTGIYCRPSCPAVTPQRRNVEFFITAAAAQAAGFRACKRCRPDLTPGSPEWDIRADVAGRAMRMIADGVVEREGVSGLASRAGYTTRHLNRILVEHLGAGPLAIARAQRAHTARILIETTDMGFADVAFAAGFASVRQFNATVNEVYASTPSELRAKRRGRKHTSPARGVVTVSLPVRQPFDADALWEFLAARAVPGIETIDPHGYSRTLRLPHGHGRVLLTPESTGVKCALELADIRDLAAAVERCRRLLDLDADPVAIDEHLDSDPALAEWVRKRPGVRVPGHVDGFEVAVRAIVGQQISVAGARTILARIASAHGEQVDGPAGLTVVFPSAEALAEADPESLPMPRARARALSGLATAVADGKVVLDRSADRADVRQALLALPGVGPWTADYIALRALGDPDVFMATDLGVRQGLARLGLPNDIAAATQYAERWRPWRSYALMYIWMTLNEGKRGTVNMSTTAMVMASPVGSLLVESDGAAITRVWFTDDEPTNSPTSELPEVLREAVRQLDAYFAKTREDFDLPLAPNGTDFQRRVWAELEKIPYGQTASYGEVAQALGMPPGASRAVGLANGANPIAIVVPCHRVIGANGTLTGYAGGLERKKYLLDLEAKVSQPGLFATG